MMAFIEGDFAYSLLLGMLAAVNPCGFVLLPAYLTAYLGVADDTDTTTRVRRALRVGVAVSAGFVAVFIVVGTISRLFTNWLEANAMYAALVIGIALMVMGVRMLGGWRPRLWVPSLTGGMGEQGQGQQGSRPRSVANMFGFGVVYAIASIGCTIGLLTTAILGSFSRHGVVSGIVSVALYGLGMGVFVTALTVSLAFAKGALVRSGRSVMKVISSVSSALVVLTGVYLTWYWYVAITQRTNSGNMVEIVGRWQTRLAEWITNVGAPLLFGVFVIVIVSALLIRRRRSTTTSSAA